MIALQIISKVLNTKDMSIIENNLLTVDYFGGYEEEFNFITEHYNEYRTVPDVATFLSKFPTLELVEVTESDRYLVDTIREEYLFRRAVPVVQNAAKLLNSDANAAAEYMLNAVKDLTPNYSTSGVDIIHDGTVRYNQYLEKADNQDKWFFTTGFPELDDMIHGIQRGEELVVLVARTNQGKSWVLEKMCTHVWELGFNVGYISPEMGADSIGYRFDTLHNHLSNNALMKGTDRDTLETSYKDYLDTISRRDNTFIVSTPLDFKKQVTVSKLRNWIKQYKLDLVAVDGITYMTDERFKRGDNKTTTLTNISEDLMALSMEMKIPIIVVVQANRSGVVESDSNDTPELESIRDSDGIAHNASMVLSIRQTKEGLLVMQVKKKRFGAVGGKVIYEWNIDKGEFTYVQGDEDRTERKARKPQTKEDIF